MSQNETTTPFADVSRQWHRMDIDEVTRFAKRLRQLPGGYSADFVTSLLESLPEPSSAEFDLLRAFAARPEMVSQSGMAYRILAVMGHRVDGDEVLSNLHARGIVEHSRVVPVIARIASRYDPDPVRRAEVADLVSAANKRHFDQRKATGVGGIMPSAKEIKIAFTLQVELSTRITSIELGSNEGVLSEALESLLSVLRQSREAMADLGASGHTGQTYQLLKQVIDTLHPVLRKWHPRLLDHQSVRPDGVGLVTHEREWVQADELRSELEQLRQPLSEIQSSLRRISGTEL